MKNVKGFAQENIKMEIMDLLQLLQKGYIERELTQVDYYMDKLFDKEEEIIILGTSNEEWFLNYDEVRDLIASDWEWWGDVTFNIEEANISALDNIAWVTTTGVVKYKYDNSEETYARWIDKVIMESFIKNDFDKETAKIDFLEINWLLNHKLHDWGKEVREYLSPIRFSAIVKKVDGRWIFKQMQFSFPQPFYPDMRIGNKEMEQERFDKIKEKLRGYTQKVKPGCKDDVKELLKDLQKDYLHSDMTPNQIIEKYFIHNDYTTIIGTDSIHAIGVEGIKEIIEKHQLEWNNISLNLEEAIVNGNSDVAWFATTGTITQQLNEDAALRRQFNNIKEIYKADFTSKEKLFNIRKNIAMTLKEIEKGNEYKWPCRIEGVLMKKASDWKIHYLQFSFPYYFILEGLRDDILLNN